MGGEYNWNVNVQESSMHGGIENRSSIRQPQERMRGFREQTNKQEGGDVTVNKMTQARREERMGPVGSGVWMEYCSEKCVCVCVGWVGVCLVSYGAVIVGYQGCQQPSHGLPIMRWLRLKEAARGLLARMGKDPLG